MQVSIKNFDFYNKYETLKVIVGICGDICSGKTVVSKQLERYGAKVFYADDVVKELYKKIYIKKKLLNLFGRGVFQNSNIKNIKLWKVDRKRLAKLIFSDQHLKKKLESIIHPIVRRRMNSFIKRYSKKIIVLDVPLLIENHIHSLCNKIIFVKSLHRQILNRLKNKKISISDYKKRKKAQINLKTKLKLSNYIINNTGSLKNLKAECRKLFKKIEEEKYGEESRK